MANGQFEDAVTLSVLDRLIDLEPEAALDPPPRHAQSLRQLKASVRRDLEWLLNTRRYPEELKNAVRELARSVQQFGLPDISSLSLSSTKDQARLLRLLENTIATFEPRLTGVRIAMDQPSGARTLRFQIQGLLRIDPTPEQVTFDTLLELSSGEYEVR